MVSLPSLIGNVLEKFALSFGKFSNCTPPPPVVVSSQPTGNLRGCRHEILPPGAGIPRYATGQNSPKTLQKLVNIRQKLTKIRQKLAKNSPRSRQKSRIVKNSPRLFKLVKNLSELSECSLSLISIVAKCDDRIMIVINL